VSAPYSISFWVKYDSIPKVNSYLISNGGQTSSSQGFYFLVEGSSYAHDCAANHPQGTVAFGIAKETNDTRNSMVITTPMLPKEWHHVAAYWDGNGDNLKLYVDGILTTDETCKRSSGAFGPQNNMRIGAPSNTLNSLNYHLTGQIDNIRIYDRALSETEIKQLANVTDPTQLTLTITAPVNGSVTGEGISCGTDCTENYEADTEVTLTAEPVDGYQFQAWGGSCTGTEVTTTVMMDSAKTCTATFLVEKTIIGDPGNLSVQKNRERLWHTQSHQP
jgi:hypothetical protein